MSRGDWPGDGPAQFPRSRVGFRAHRRGRRRRSAAMAWLRRGATEIDDR